jgi:quercetin dioxygenase-like cupin family protein
MFLSRTSLMAAASGFDMTIVYVVRGSLEYTVEGKPPVTLEAGDVLFIAAGAAHEVRNVGTGDAAELATYIVEKGKPLLVTASATS